MAVIALRIPDKMKQDMTRVKLNWSEYIRVAIEEVLTSQKKRKLLEKLTQLTRGHLKPSPPHATRLIREIRDHA